MDAPEWNPGGWLAKKNGCTCPRIENNFGAGSHLIRPPYELGKQYIESFLAEGISFVFSKDCHMHSRYTDPKPDATNQSADSVNG